MEHEKLLIFLLMKQVFLNSWQDNGTLLMINQIQIMM